MLLCNTITVALHQIADPLQLTSVTQKVRSAFHRQVHSYPRSVPFLLIQNSVAPTKFVKYTQTHTHTTHRQGIHSVNIQTEVADGRDSACKLACPAGCKAGMCCPDRGPGPVL
jgi:hypothetical protein